MKNLLKLSIFVVLCLFLSFIVLEGLIILEGNKKYAEEVDYLFILGAKLYGDKPSPVLLERLKVGVTYLKEHPTTKVIVTGGKGDDELISEAEAMKKYLVNNGIEKSRIIKEDKSVNTFQNIKFGLEEIREFDSKENIEILIATSKFHILRSKLISKRLNLKAYGLPAKVPPTILIQAYIREYFGLIKSFIFDK